MSANRTCFYCASRFEASAQRRLFCSDICKQRWNRESEEKCFYCGEIADGRDHLTPHASMFGSARIMRRRFVGYDTVLACKECNSTLSNNHPYSLVNRIEFLAKKMTKKYDLDKQVPEWDDEELDELGATLRTAVEGSIHARQRALQRVGHMMRRRDLVAECVED